MIRSIYIFLLIVSFFASSSTYAVKFKIARLQYGGGGDWYSNPTSLKNLIAFCNKELKTNIDPEPEDVEAGSSDIYNYPFIHMTGHGNVIFNNQEVENLRNYLLGGGFLHIDDNYGMDKFVRRELAKVFPDKDLIELPSSHAIYHQKFDFKNGLPKVHEHDNKTPQGFGIMHEGRLILYYTYETDLGDGWEDPEVHGDSEETRAKALKMGANLVQYVFYGSYN